MSEKIGMFGLRPIFSERIWGVTELPAPYPQPKPGHPVGEVWLTAEECQVTSGPWEGKTLAEVSASAPEALAAKDGFPLLIKVLLPKEKLSVQVHPNDAEAQARGEKRGKTECWYVLEAEPGAELALGLKTDDVEDVRKAIADGTMESLMQMVPVKAGDMVFVDAGTVHAIGPGLVVLETQQYSDTTFRLWDYGRPRELHVEQGLLVTKTKTRAGLVAPVKMAGFTRLIESAYFAVDRFELSAGKSVELGETGKVQMLFALGEGCSVRAKDGDAELRVPKGEIVVLPAEGVEYEVRSHAAAGLMRVLAP